MDAIECPVVPHAERLEVHRRPTCRAARWITDQDRSSSTHESRCDIQRDQWGSKAARGDEVDGALSRRIEEHLDIDLGHRHSIRETECPAPEPKEIGPLGTPFNQLDLEQGSIDSDHQRRESAARPEIDGGPGMGRTASHEETSVSDGIGHRDGTNSAAPLDLLQDASEISVVRHLRER